MRSIPYIIKRTIFLIKERGIVNSYKFMYSRYGYFLKYGIRLSKVYTPDELNLPNMYAYKYEPIMHYSFNRMLDEIDWNWNESIFIDIGCGKELLFYWRHATILKIYWSRAIATSGRRMP